MSTMITRRTHLATSTGEHGRTIAMTLALLMTAVHAVVAQTGPAGFGQRFEMSELRVTVTVPDSTTWTGTSRAIGGLDIAEVVTGVREGSTFRFIATPAREQTCETMLRAAAVRPGAQTVADLPYAPASAAPAIRVGTAELFCMSLYGTATVISLEPGRLSPTQQVSMRRLLQAVADIAGRPLPSAAIQLGLRQPVQLEHLGITVPVGEYWYVATITGPGGEPLDELSRLGRNRRDRNALVLSRRADAGSCIEALATATGRSGVRQSSEHFPSGWVASSAEIQHRLTGCLELQQGVLLATIPKINDAGDRASMNMLMTGVRLAAEQQWGLR